MTTKAAPLLPIQSHVFSHFDDIPPLLTENHINRNFHQSDIYTNGSTRLIDY